MRYSTQLLTLLMFLSWGAALQAADDVKTLPEAVRPDLAGEAIAEVANNVRTVRKYDSKGFVISKVIHSADGRESKWLYSYDTHGRLIELTNPDQSRLLYVYADEKELKPSRIKLFGPDGVERQIQ